MLRFTTEVIFSFGFGIKGVFPALEDLQCLLSCKLLFPEGEGVYCGSQFERLSVHHSGEGMFDRRCQRWPGSRRWLVT